MNYYECHITFLYPPNALPLDVRGWKFSQIDGDPNMGDGVKAYLTRQYRATNAKDAVIDALEDVAAEVTEMGYEVLRTKVELVVYDNRRRAAVQEPPA